MSRRNSLTFERVEREQKLRDKAESKRLKRDQRRAAKRSSDKGVTP